MQTKNNDHNLVRFIEYYYSSMAAPQINTPEAFVWFTGLNMPVSNAVTHFHYKENIPAHLESILKIAPEGKPLSFWIDEFQDATVLKEELETRNFKKAVTIPFMVWNVAALEKPTTEIKRTTPKTFDLFTRILGSVFGLDDKTAHDYGILLGRSSAEHYIIYVDEKAVGAGTLFVSGNTGLILNIAVLPEYQRKGLGSAISQFLMHRAYELKLEKVVLNANPAAISMYQKLGFKTTYDLDIYAK